jgi:hypothetical protein
MAEEIRFESELNDLLDREPFVPFTIVVASGDCYRVTGPRQVAIGENVIIVVPVKSTHAFFRKNQVVGIEVEEPAV